MCIHAQEIHEGMTIQGQIGAVDNAAPFMQWNKMCKETSNMIVENHLCRGEAVERVRV